MPGVRLHHPTLRNCIFTVRHDGRRLRPPLVCLMCREVHEFKTYHLRLDQVGDVVVSEVVYERLREAGLEPLKATKEIQKPETIVVEIGGKRESYTIVRKEV